MRIRNRSAQRHTFSFKRTRRAGDSKRRLQGVLINVSMDAHKGVENYQALQEYVRFESRMGSNVIDVYV